MSSQRGFIFFLMLLGRVSNIFGSYAGQEDLIFQSIAATSFIFEQSPHAIKSCENDKLYLRSDRIFPTNPGSSLAEAKTTQESNLKMDHSQDRPNLSTDNPMKKLSRFLFFSMVPTTTKKAADQILTRVELELARVGKVNKSKILVEKDKGKVIDLQSLDAPATLIYELDNVTDINGKDLGIIRASLNLTTAVQIEETKQVCRPYIWSSNCFLKGSVEKNVQELVSQSLGYLLSQFQAVFIEANSFPPVFDLQGAE